MDFKHKKRFGQNFISDTNYLRSLVFLAGIKESDNVLEIGAGAGGLTKELCAAADFVAAYEIDVDLQPILSENLKDCKNLNLVFKDVMKAGAEEINMLFSGRDSREYKLIANLPYYITTPIIFKFLELSDEGSPLLEICIMIQKEVAERLAAKEGTAEYGALTVAAATRCDVKILKIVDRKMFYPVPNVDSAFVSLRINKKKFDIKNRAVLDRLVKSAFAMRRKTLVNNLLSSFGISRLEIERILAENGIPLTARGETLSPAQFVRLSDFFQ